MRANTDADIAKNTVAAAALGAVAGTIVAFAIFAGAELGAALNRS